MRSLLRDSVLCKWINMDIMEKKPISELLDDRLRHIAFIMDGNGRWAKKRGLPRELGHKAGAEAFRRVADYCGKIGIRYVTVYVFSTENWRRPKREVDAILSLLRDYIREGLRDLEKNKIHYVFLGNRSVFGSEEGSVGALMKQLEDASAGYDLTLNLAVNYGGREELVHAVNAAAEAGEALDEQHIGAHLYTAHCPDPDLIVRSANERRLSNFLLWQAAYAELYFTETLWPDFGPADVDAAIYDFYERTRRYGGLV